MYIEYIDIDEYLAELWQRIYVAIIDIAKQKGLINKEINLADSLLLESIFVSYDGIISLHDVYGNISIAEDFDDEVLFEAYRQLYTTISTT